MSPATLRAWRNAVFAIFFLSGLGLASWVSRVPAVRDALGLSTADVGIVIFGASVGAVTGLLVATPLLAAVGARRAMVIGIGVAALGLLVVGLGTSVLPASVLVIAGLAVVGLGTGAVDVIMNVEGAAAERAIGKTLMPLMHACFSLGTVVGALLGAAASHLELSVLSHLVIIGALAFGTALGAVRFIPVIAELGDEGPAHTGAIVIAAAVTSWRDRLRASLRLWRDAKLLLIGVVVLGMTFAEGSANDWLALASVDGHGLSNTVAAVVFGVFVAAMTVGRVLGGPLLDRFGRVAVLRACAVTAGAGLLLFILAPNVGVVFAGTVLWGLGASLGFPVGMSAAADDSKNAAARVSVVAIIGYVAFFGPPVLGLLGEAWGILNALLVILVLIVLAGIAAPAARKPAPAPEPLRTP